MREKLASRIGFIFLSAGCAIGLGNVWRFPYVAGRSGGGWFVALYLVFLALIGIPILVMEFAAGRASQRSIAGLHAALTPEKKPWRVHGAAGTAGTVLLMMFYTTVTGWMLVYFWKMAAGVFSGMDSASVGAEFGSMLGDWRIQTAAMLAVTLGAAVVCAVGLQKGLERVTKWMMASLLALIVVLAVNSVLLEGAGEGLKFFLVPSLSRMREIGVAKVCTEAMNQAFFTLSLGIGAMAIFGSYIGKERTLFGEAVNVCVLDTVVAISAGLVILPACFAYSVEPGQGPGLVFVTLPNVFNHMPCGRLWGSLFFAFLAIAALTTVLAEFETIVACIRDCTGWRRPRTCIVVAAGLTVLALPCIFGFNLWSDFHPLGPGSNVLDIEDFMVSNVLLPLGGIAFALYCSHRYGWGWRSFVAEANTGTGPKIPWSAGILRIYCGYVLPLAVSAIFVVGMLEKFHIGGF